MGQGGYIICEWDSVQKEYREWQKAFAGLEEKIIDKCLRDWDPKKFGGLTPNSEEFGRTTILPALFEDNAGLPMDTTSGGGSPAGTWRQIFTTEGHQTLLAGARAASTIAEDFKIAWLGLAFPNKEQHITEIRWQTSDRKYGRINIEEMKVYNKPAIIFEEGFLINEESAFELYGYVQGPIPVDHEGNTRLFQRIVMLGAAYYKIIDKVLGAPGAAI